MSYLQPIETIVGMMNSYYEDGILKSVQQVGFNVNKEELEKALLYDRGQYEKGYSDGKVETIDKMLEILDEIDDGSCITIGCMTYGGGKDELKRRVSELFGKEGEQE